MLVSTYQEKRWLQSRRPHPKSTELHAFNWFLGLFFNHPNVGGMGIGFDVESLEWQEVGLSLK